MTVLLIVIVVIFSAAAATVAACVFAVNSRGEAFVLPAPLSEREMLAAVRSLTGADERGTARANFALAAGYLKRAYRMLVVKSHSGEELEDYERIFADNYMNMLIAEREVGDALPALSRLPVRKEGGILAFASVVVRSTGGATDPEVFARCAAMLGAKKSLTWDELKALRPALRLALLETAAVYASKMLFRRRLAVRAAKDAKRGKAAPALCAYASYVRAYSAGGDIPEGRDAYSAAAEDDAMLAEYAAGMELLAAALRRDVVTDELLVSLSSPAEIYLSGGCAFEDLSLRTRTDMLMLTGRYAKKRKVSEERSGRKVESGRKGYIRISHSGRAAIYARRAALSVDSPYRVDGSGSRRIRAAHGGYRRDIGGSRDNVRVFRAAFAHPCLRISAGPRARDEGNGEQKHGDSDMRRIALARRSRKRVREIDDSRTYRPRKDIFLRYTCRYRIGRIHGGGSGEGRAAAHSRQAHVFSSQKKCSRAQTRRAFGVQ